jgi:hypothetical protein
LARRKVVGLAACVLVVAAVAGCGDGEGVSEGAAVVIYVDAPLCVGAERALAKEGGEAGPVRVRIACLESARDDSRLNLSTVGANARRATENSATIAYIEAPAVPSFSRPIVEAAGIPVIRSDSGATAIDRLLGAIDDADSGSLRDSVRGALN